MQPRHSSVQTRRCRVGDRGRSLHTKLILARGVSPPFDPLLPCTGAAWFFLLATGRSPLFILLLSWEHRLHPSSSKREREPEQSGSLSFLLRNGRVGTNDGASERSGAG
jgi:hypothetical protein